MAILTGIAAAAGAIAPLVTSIYSEYSQNKRDRVTRGDIEKVIKENDVLSAEQKSAVTRYFDENRVTNKEDVGIYVDKLRNMSFAQEYEKYGADLAKEFTYDKTKEDFYNENASKILGDTIAKTQGLASAQGMGRSFDGLQSMTQASIDKNAELMRDAQSDYRDDYSQKYQEFTDYLNQTRNRYLDRTNAMQSDLNLASDLAQFAHDYDQSEFEHLMNLDTNRINNKLKLQSAKAGI